jgi:hypothetical protein
MRIEHTDQANGNVSKEFIICTAARDDGRASHELLSYGVQ